VDLFIRKSATPPAGFRLCAQLVFGLKTGHRSCGGGRRGGIRPPFAGCLPIAAMVHAQPYVTPRCRGRWRHSHRSGNTSRPRTHNPHCGWLHLPHEATGTACRCGPPATSTVNFPSQTRPQAG
jgi:hypothetical protein